MGVSQRGVIRGGGVSWRDSGCVPGGIIRGMV